jgi:hypothetical protein
MDGSGSSKKRKSIMSYLKFARPVALAALVALGVAAAGSAEARTGLQAQHGPSALVSKDANGPSCPAGKPCN